MRKVLLATSALAAGTAFATAANAAAPEMSIFGSLDVQYQSESYDKKNSAGNTVAGKDAFGYLNFMNSIHFDINAEADNGLAYGGRVDWRPSNHTIDEIWIDFKGGFGTIVAGNDDSVGDNNVPHGGSVLVGSFGWTGTYVAGSSAKVGNANVSAESTSRNFDAAKVSYYTPDLGGFGAGFSWTPDDNNSGTTYDSQTEVAAWWSGDLGGASMTAGALYRMADATATTNEDLRAYEIGATVSVAGFNLGAGYHDNGESGTAKGSSASAGNGFSLGVGYSMGATSVSLGYLSTELENADATSDDYSNIAFDIEHSVAEGLIVYGGIQFAESTDASATGNGSNQESTSVIVGTRVSF
jgi:hypothetical protein